ncbi:MAG: hypothetical protein AAGB25_08885 [Pseudomonadota bacterium]
MLKTLVATALIAAFAAPTALAGPAERLERIDNRFNAAERNGAWAEGSRADYVENRFDRFEDRVDRREDVRDRSVNNGWRDRLEDRLDSAENIRDRRENRIDRND